MEWIGRREEEEEEREEEERRREEEEDECDERNCLCKGVFVRVEGGLIFLLSGKEGIS